MSEIPASPETVPETIPFTLPSEYGPALDRVLALAAAEILVFDRDLRDGGWNAPARIEVLRAFLLGRHHSRMQIIVHETTFIEGHLPRLMLLLRDFSYKFSILHTIEDGRKAWDAFVIVDGRHVAHRFHQDSPRGELALNAPLKSQQLRDRYDDILAFTEPGVNATLFGL
jgi:hypothetical protein